MVLSPPPPPSPRTPRRFSPVVQTTWTTLLGDARQGLVNADPSLAPPEDGDLPIPPNASTSIGFAGGSGAAAMGTSSSATAIGGPHHQSSSSHEPLVPPTPQSEAAGGGGWQNRAATASTGAPGTAMSSVGGSGGGRTNALMGTAVASPGGDSVDGRSSTALPEGGGRGGGRGKGTGSGGGLSSGPSHFDTEMEANRLAYVLHLQVCCLLWAVKPQRRCVWEYSTSARPIGAGSRGGCGVAASDNA